MKKPLIFIAFTAGVLISTAAIAQEVTTQPPIMAGSSYIPPLDPKPVIPPATPPAPPAPVNPEPEVSCQRIWDPTQDPKYCKCNFYLSTKDKNNGQTSFSTAKGLDTEAECIDWCLRTSNVWIDKLESNNPGYEIPAVETCPRAPVAFNTPLPDTTVTPLR